MKLYQYFLPHPQTHEKSKFLHWHLLLIYVLLFLLLRVGFNLVELYRPGVLGVNSSISVSEVIAQTNQQRQKLGFSALVENRSLDTAAQAKAQNMFDENYWAHFSPSGKDPWGFINRSGYKFSYAGENLARNFYTSDDVVKAWMNSASHKENIVNPHYQEIGVAVVDGVLLGQKTTLVVQMFGRPIEAIATTSQVDLGGQKIVVKPEEQSVPIGLVAGFTAPKTAPAKVDPFFVTKVVGFSLITFVTALLVIDFVVLHKRGVFRITSSHLAHLSFLAISSGGLIIVHSGSIL